MSSQSQPATPAAARVAGWDWQVPRAEAEAPTEAPAPPRGPRTGLIVAAVVAALAVAVTGLVAVLGGGGPPVPESSRCEGADCGQTETEGPRAMEIPEGHLGVVSLGALTPHPGTPWSDYAGPGADELLADDAHALAIRHTDRWISYFMVGRLGEFGLIAEPENLRRAAVEIVDTWVFDYPYSGTTGLEMSDPKLTETVVDSQPAVLLETRVTWDTLDSSPDAFEDLALLLVDPGEGGIFLGVAAVPESGTAHYEAAVDALMRTTFRHNTYLP
ncbi:hypothetical protein L0U85_14100 [Glycomyces sp. L485]|uniref:hypothetical protein n=1 Tax=Glycomyces sp. L485 TaxID=2909235 RepID=UPI001F4AA881|nr:hypothetical protein [Glycomyces sp. L485]MCH7231978.1 hypothetical protein [Glycomyces sp. L485]